MELMHENRGASYNALLSRFHRFLQPQTYLEIGTLYGGTLELADCPSICVDPAFKLDVNPTGSRPFTMFFQKTSDRFFRDHSPRDLFGKALDLVFLDGLHEAETLLRDFSNVEKHCRRNSIICMHDCIPMNVEMTARVNDGTLWTGDVWKVVPILKKFRPDLSVYAFDAGPTALICCTDLDPSNTTLDDAAASIWREWRSIELGDYGFERMIEEADLIWTEKVATAEDLRRYFWL